MLHFPLAVLVAVVSCSLVAAAPAGAAPAPTWDKVITKGAGRFKVLPQFDDEAVLDKETGLVWERTPSGGTSEWGDALKLCVGAPVGGRRGWRLPTIWELMTLSDPSVSDPSLPVGHPFVGISTVDNYWSSTTDPDNPANALRERFGIGGGGVIIGPKTDLHRRWCVRGPGGEYAQ
jgi:hypothetical protein